MKPVIVIGLTLLLAGLYYIVLKGFAIALGKVVNNKDAND